MVVTQENRKILYNAIQVVEDLTAYAAQLRLFTDLPVKVNQPIIIDNGEETTKWAVYEGDQQRSNFITLVPYLYHELLNKQFPPICADYTLSELMSTYGIPLEDTTTQKSHFIIPRCKYKTMIDSVTELIITNNGGGYILYITPKSTLKLYDLKAINRQEGTLLSGSCSNIRTSRSWIAEYPGAVTLTLYTEDGEVTKELLFEEGFGHGALRKRVHKETMVNAETRLRNAFYYRYYLMSSVDVTGMISPALVGSKVNLKELGDYVVLKAESDFFRKDFNAKLVKCQKSL